MRWLWSLVVRYVFPLAVAVCETGAALVYLSRGEWRLAIIWIGYAFAAWALAGVK
jgi:hypothetical protein